MSHLITMTTDFGRADSYVAQMTATALSIHPGVRIVEITHQVPPQDILAGAYHLALAWGWFPPGSVHLAVIDPGVGTARRGVAFSYRGHWFVGPDNGLFDLVLNGDSPDQLFHLSNPHDTQSVSPVFHGRDIFAPVAANIAKNESVSGALSDIPLCSLNHRSYWIEGDSLFTNIVNIDHFGNCQTLLPRSIIENDSGYRVILPDGLDIGTIHQNYSEVPSGSPVAILSSADTLEVAVRNGNAASQFGLRRGDSIRLR